MDSSWTFHPDEGPVQEGRPDRKADKKADKKAEKRADRKARQADRTARRTAPGPADRPAERRAEPRTEEAAPGEVHRLSWVPRVGLVAVASALVIGILALAGLGPFKAAPAGSPETPVGIVGTWNVLVAYHLSFSPEHMTITTEDHHTGVFTGTVTSPVGDQTVSGRVTGSTVSFIFRFGQGTEAGSATLTTVSGQLRMTGSFVNSSGQSGGISAVRTSG